MISFIRDSKLGLDQAELAMCANIIDSETLYADDKVQQRCEILQCVTEYTWVVALIDVVIAVVSIVLAIFTFGFSLLLTTVTFAAWVLVPILVCSLIPCPEDGFSIIGDGLFSEPTNGSDCPPGSFYAGSFVGCTHGPISSGIFRDLVAGEDYWSDVTGVFHRPVCN